MKQLTEKGYLNNYEYEDNGKGGIFNISLNGRINGCGAIKPRFSVKLRDMERHAGMVFHGRGSHLVPELEDGLQGEATPAEVEAVLQTGTQKIHDHCIVITFNTKPMDCRNSSC